MKAVIDKMDEEEIKKLPFPETARIIGGLLKIEYIPIEENSVKKLGSQFRRSVLGIKICKLEDRDGK